MYPLIPASLAPFSTTTRYATLLLVSVAVLLARGAGSVQAQSAFDGSHPSTDGADHFATFSTSLPRNTESRQLSFVDRVAYQYAIEGVYWRHRIWPKENARPKPPLDEVISPEQVQQKVKNYLRNSQLLAEHWQRPITSEQLQGEMERMARDTKQPAALRELFGALENDPAIIAECLARPVLTERLVTELSARDEEYGKQAVESERGAQPVASERKRSDVHKIEVSGGYRLPELVSNCTDDNWTATSTTNAPAVSKYYTAVWTGTEMIIWGGYGETSAFNTGSRYNPSTDSWVATTTTNAPGVRGAQAAVWTGTEMIVWGGGNSLGPVNTGGRYNPSADSWVGTTITNAPVGRRNHTAVWTGSEMIVWGGYTFEGVDTHTLNTGGRYNPHTDSWAATALTNVPLMRQDHTAVWTGSEMIVWGGFSLGSYWITGGRYNPITDIWVSTTTIIAPTKRSLHTAVWTGSEMIVWGGSNASGSVNTGGRYNPGTNSWVATPTTNAPDARQAHTAVWTGSQMIIWGGGATFNTYLNTGSRYNPSTDSWVATSTTNAPSSRQGHTAVWTGSEMIAWGGSNSSLLNNGGIYCAPPSSLGNISTRMRVQAGDNALIGGFIIAGSAPKSVAVRGIGPSLSQFGVPDVLADPTLELHDGGGALLLQNDNWQDDPLAAAQLTALGLDLQNPNESGIVSTLQPGASYTAILAGKNRGTGVGLVEIYDTNPAASSQLANISTRGFVLTGDNVMIGGFILGGTNNAQVVVRGIGPSLSQFGLNPVVADPTLELHNANGTLLVSNDNWQDDSASAALLSAHGLGLSDPNESGIFQSLPPGAFTAILAGKNGGTGIGLVEIYNLH
jgi:N-acetylneuraminic acid mutarotase